MPSPMPGMKVSDIDGIVCRGPDDILQPPPADRRAARHQRQILHLARQWRRQPDPGGGDRHHGDQRRSRDNGDLRLWPRFLVAHAFVGRSAGEATRPRRTTSCRRNSRPEYGYFGAVAAHAFGATRHMHLYGTTRDQFGEIAVAFREHALRNPDAQMKKPLSTKRNTTKRQQIVAPFGLYDCSLRSDGAGAVIVTSRERARDLKQPPVSDQGLRQLQQSARLVQRRQHGGDGGEDRAARSPTRWRASARTTSTARRSTTASPTWC